MDILFLHLKPANYMTAQSMDSIIHLIETYPEQLMNTEEAINGLTIEFVLFDGPDQGQPVGSLSEFVQSHNILLFKVSTRDGDDIVIEADTTTIPFKFIIYPEQKNSL